MQLTINADLAVNLFIFIVLMPYIQIVILLSLLLLKDLIDYLDNLFCKLAN
jgi:hypothetical protein